MEEDNPADRSGDVDREPLKKKLDAITSGHVCPSCDEVVILEEDDYISLNGQTVHEECFFEDMEEIEEENN